MSPKFRSNVLTFVLAAASAAAFAGGTHDEHADNQAVGEAGKAAQVSRTVTIDMTDNMRFNPSELAVQQGETIRFVVKNSGQLKHEMVIGTPQELKEHYDMMMKMPQMEHTDASQVTVAPGKSGELIWRFTKSGKVDFACLQPGHYDAGMKGIVNVAAGKQAPQASAHDGHQR